jgi:hypothetical protein
MTNGPPRPPPKRRIDSPPAGPVSDLRELRSAPAREPTLAEVAGRVSVVDSKIDSLQGEVKGLRSDLSTLSRFVMEDLASRLTATEKRTPVQQVSRAACWAGKGTAYATFIAVGARMLGKAFPQFDGAINDLLGAFGL